MTPPIPPNCPHLYEDKNGDGWFKFYDGSLCLEIEGKIDELPRAWRLVIAALARCAWADCVECKDIEVALLGVAWRQWAERV